MVSSVPPFFLTAPKVNFVSEGNGGAVLEAGGREECEFEFWVQEFWTSLFKALAMILKLYLALSLTKIVVFAFKV